MTSESSFWKAAIAGKRVEIHADYPQAGYYYMRQKPHPPLPVRIWINDLNILQCSVGYDTLSRAEDPCDVWTWCADKPLSKARYELFARTQQFPPPDRPLTKLAEATARAIAASDDGGELESLAVRLEAARKAEVFYCLEAKRQIDVAHKYLIDMIEAALKVLKEARG